MSTPVKHYPHITGVFGDEGETPGVLSVTAILDPSPNWPETARVIVGSPQSSPALSGPPPQLGLFSGGVQGIGRLATTLLEALTDVQCSMGVVAPSIAAILDTAEEAAVLLENLARGNAVPRCEHRLAESVRALISHVRVTSLPPPADGDLDIEQLTPSAVPE